MSDTTPIPRMVIRVVKVPTTGELLDEYYREKGFLNGSTSTTGMRGTGCRHVPAKTTR